MFVIIIVQHRPLVKYFSKCFVSINSFNPYNSLIIIVFEVLIFFHFIDGKTGAQRG